MRLPHGPGPILRMSFNGASRILSFVSCVIELPIGGRHPLMRYWQPLGAKTTATCSLLHLENECQLRFNRVCNWLFSNQGIVRMLEHITELLPALIGTNTIFERKNRDSKLNDIASCKTSKNILLVLDYTMLIRYYYETAKIRAFCESIEGPAGRPTDNPPSSDVLEDYHRTLPELTVWVFW